MTVTSGAMISGPYLADGVNTEFSFTFKIKDADHLQVVVSDDAAGTNAVYYPSGYTVDDQWLDKDTGGIVDFEIGGNPVTSGKNVWIIGNAPYEQAVEFKRQGPYNPLQVMDALDSLAIQGKQTAEKLGRAVIGNPGGAIITPDGLADLSSSASASAVAAAGSATSAYASALTSVSHAALALSYRDQAVAAGEAIGSILFYDTYALANAALGSIANLGVVEVFVDETRGNTRTRYRKEGGVLVYKVTITEITYLTPEMYGAVGDNSSHALSTRYGSLAAAQAVYSFATSLTQEIDWCAITKCMADARTRNVPIYGFNEYYIDAPIVDYAAGEEYWNGSTNNRPLLVFINRIKTTSIDCALKLKGVGIIGPTWTVNDMEGPGLNAGNLGTATTVIGGAVGNERIGILIEDFVRVCIRSIFGFNKALTLQNAYSCDIRVGYMYANYQDIEGRLHPVTGVRSQGNTIRTDSFGGVFNYPGQPDEVYRRSRSAKIGVKLRGFVDCTFYFIMGYVTFDSTSTAFDTDNSCYSNKYHIYFEGIRDDGTFGHIGDMNSEVWLTGMGTPNDVKEGTLLIDGAGTKVHGAMFVSTAAAKSARVADQSAAILEVDPTVEFVGAHKIHKALPPSSLEHALITLGTPMNFAGDGSVTMVTDGPSELEVEQVAQLTASADGGVRWTSNAIVISGDTSGRKKLKVVGALRGVTNHARIACYVLDDTTSTVIGGGFVTAVKSTSGWSVFEFIEEIPPGVTGIKVEYCVRNTTTYGETGCVVRVRRPFATFNVETRDYRRLAAVLPSVDTITGRIATGRQTYFMANDIIAKVSTTLNSNALDTEGKGEVYMQTVGGGGTTINAITNLVDNAPCIIINDTGSNYTVSDGAGEWTSSFTLTAGTAIMVIQRGGKVFKMV